MSYIKNKEYRFNELLDKYNNFIIPEYQRKLEWDDEIFISLLASLSDVASFGSVYDSINKYEKPLDHGMKDGTDFKKKQLFLGNIVLHDKNVVDGQQRLTALMIIMKAILSLYEGRNGGVKDKILDSLSGYLRPFVKGTYEPLIQSRVATQKGINKKFLENDDKLGRFKIYKLYKSAIKKLKKTDKENNEVFLRRLSMTAMMVYNTQFIVLEVENLEDSFEIFETLNSKSTPLKPADLVKNKVMGTLIHEEGIDEKQIFSTIFENIGDADPTSFYRMCLTIYKAMKIDEKVYPESAIYIQKSALFKSEFAQKEKDEIKERIIFIEQISSIFKEYFVTKKTDNKIKNIANRFFNMSKVKVLSTLTLYFAFLYEKKKISLESFVRLSTWIENFFIGMFTLSNNAAKEVDKIVPKLIRSIDRLKEKTFVNIAKTMKMFLIKQYPQYNDGSLDGVYEIIKTKTFNNRAGIHLLNKLFDEYSWEKNKKNQHFSKTIDVINDYSSTLEHLLPQKPIKWDVDNLLSDIESPKDINSIDQDEELYKQIYSIGNLFILTASSNSSLGNSVISDKVKKLNEKARNDDKELIRKTMYLKENFMNTKIWSSVEIEARTNKIYQIFKDFDLLELSVT